ncbi:MAG: carboxylating nicotinate-nucleotide diphosphorylase [Acidobacteriota bacterium]
MRLPRILYEEIVRIALREDLGRGGDLTSDSIIPLGTPARGRIITREPGCAAGLAVATLAFELLDPNVKIKHCVAEGQRIAAGDVLAEIEGEARVVLTGERTCLNFLALLCGIASETRRIVDRIQEYHAKIVCTRKTTPGLRTLEKYAVRAGGGFNHRFGLDDAVLIKDNHLAIAGSIEEAVRRIRYCVGHMVKVEVEVETLEQLEAALRQPIDAVLLDNMTIEQVREAVKIVDGRVTVEVSGGITPDEAVEYAAAGVDLISLGWLTHSSPALDVSMEIERI